MDEHKTMRWWRLLATLAVMNLGLYAWNVHRADLSDPWMAKQLVLSGIYTAVCAFRSWWPRIDLERTVLWDTPLSSIVAGRSAATVAEVCFAMQIALVVHELGAVSGLGWMQAIAPAIVFALALAQVFCWSSVVSLSHAGHAIEEAIWGVTFAVVGILLFWAAPLAPLPWPLIGLVAGVLCMGYCAFMALVDVPMYVKRWRSGEHTERLSFAEGFQDALTRREPTKSWAVWKPEVAWLTGYFTGAVWLSQAIVWLPR